MRRFDPSRPSQFIEIIMARQQHINAEHSFYTTPETYIHPSSIIGPNVTLGDGVKIGPYCVIMGNTTIGNHTRIGAYTSIGLHAQHTQTPQNIGVVHIGSRCEIREYVSIHAPIQHDGATTIGDDCYLMNYAHVAHNVTLEHHVILTNQVNLAGHVYIEHHGYLMANAGVHQYCRIGKYSCLTPYSGIRQDIPPFSMFTGQPAQFSGLHRISLEKNGFDGQSITALQTVTNLFYKEKLLLPAIIAHAKAHKSSWGGSEYVQDFISFIAQSSRGVSKRALSYGKTTYYE